MLDFTSWAYLRRGYDEVFIGLIIVWYTIITITPLLIIIFEQNKGRIIDEFHRSVCFHSSIFLVVRQDPRHELRCNLGMRDPGSLVDHRLWWQRLAWPVVFNWWLSGPMTWLCEEWKNYIPTGNIIRYSYLLVSVKLTDKFFIWIVNIYRNDYDTRWFTYNNYSPINEEESRVASELELVTKPLNIINYLFVISDTSTPGKVRGECF